MCLIQSSGLHMNCITLKIIAQSIAAGKQFRIFSPGDASNLIAFIVWEVKAPGTE